MTVLNEDMKKLVKEVRLAYAATAGKDGVPNVSPKGSIRVVDDNTLAFACLWSKKTIQNLKENPNIALAVVDTAARKGFQFKGKAVLEDKGSLYDEMAAQMAGGKFPKPKFIARIAVSEVAPIPSTA